MSPQCLDKRNPIEPPISLSDVADVNLYTANRIKWILRTLIMNEKFISRSVRQADKTKLEISLSRHCWEVRSQTMTRSHLCALCADTSTRRIHKKRMKVVSSFFLLVGIVPTITSYFFIAALFISS